MSHTIKELPNLERPREKLKRNGVRSLSDEELIAIVLRTGTKETSAKDLAITISSKVEGLKNLEKESIDSLKQINGVGDVKAITLLATLELGRRLNVHDFNQKLKIKCAEDIYLLYKDELRSEQEVLYVLFLNSKNQINYGKVLFQGTINQSIVHPREIFKEAVKYAAVKIVLIHNHPSGNATPSKEDYHFTNKIIACGEMMEIPVMDHIIIGNGEYFSFCENELYNSINGEK